MPKTPKTAVQLLCHVPRAMWGGAATSGVLCQSCLPGVIMIAVSCRIRLTEPIAASFKL